MPAMCRCRGIALLWAGVALAAGPPEVTKLEPPNWWAGHSINPVRLLIRGKNLQGARMEADHSGVETGLTRVNAAGTYAFVDVSVASDAEVRQHNIRIRTDQGE